MAAAMNSVNDNICPLCQDDNGCEVSSQKVREAKGCSLTENDDIPCWCFDLTLSQDLLAKVPEGLINKACICQTCIKKSDLGVIPSRFLR